MSPFTFRPEKRELSRLIIGLAGPTKSGKTMSAHRLAAGLANGGQVVKINAEGPNGHLYAERFPCLVTDIQPPYRPARFTEALRAAIALDPAVVIVDSASHMHDGPGGLLEYHEEELDRIAGKTDWKKRERSTWTAWIKPKAEENEFIYTMLGSSCHIILCFRAKEKLKLIRGKEPIDLGWQPIAGDRITFETIFTLTLPPHCKGVPDLAVSELREGFDKMIPAGQALDEETGATLAAWAAGGEAAKESDGRHGERERSPEVRSGGDESDPQSAPPTNVISDAQRRRLRAIQTAGGVSDEALRAMVDAIAGVDSSKLIPVAKYEALVAAVEAAGATEEQPRFRVPDGVPT